MPKEFRKAACGTREGGEAAGLSSVAVCLCVRRCACSHMVAVHRMCTGWHVSSLHPKSKCTEGLENSDPKVTLLRVLWRQRLSLIYLCDPESLGSGLSRSSGNDVRVSGGEDCPSWDGILQRGSLWAQGSSGD